MLFGHALAHAAHAADENDSIAFRGDCKLVHGLHTVGNTVLCLGIIQTMRPFEVSGPLDARQNVVLRRQQEVRGS